MAGDWWDLDDGTFWSRSRRLIPWRRFEVYLLRNHHVCRVVRRRADRSVGAAVGDLLPAVERRVSLICETLLHTPCCTGLTVKLQNQATDALKPAYEELARTFARSASTNLPPKSETEGLAVDVRRRNEYGLRPPLDACR